MKKMTLVLLVALITSGLFAGEGSTTATTNSTMLLAAPGAYATTNWVASTAYVQGELAAIGSATWFALEAGTSSTNAPSGLSDFTDGTVVWRKALSKPRSFLFVSNEGSERVTISWSSGVVAGEGITLPAGRAIALSKEDVPQSAVHMISDSGAPSVSTMER